MTAKDFIEFYQQYCDARGWVLTRTQWIQLDVIARGMGPVEYRRFMHSPAGSTFKEILSHMDDYYEIEVLGIA